MNLNLCIWISTVYKNVLFSSVKRQTIGT
jgi:hypothetical protein